MGLFYGENQAEYGNAIEENKNALMSMDFFSSDNPHELLFGGVKVEDYIKDNKYSLNDFAPYIAPDRNNLIEAGVEKLGDLVSTDYFEKNHDENAVSKLMEDQSSSDES